MRNRIHAVYREAILPEHQGNPLIEALPPKVKDEILIDAFTYYPDLDEHIRMHPEPLVREEYLSRLKTLRQPLSDYIRCFRLIERAIKDGYSSKNPLSPSTVQYVHYLMDDRPQTQPYSGFFEPKADTITLIGESGTGKTSMLEQVLNYFPSVIEHTQYRGQSIEVSQQVVWIKVDCPDKSSVRDLCEEILLRLDLATGVEQTKPAGTIGSLMRQIEQRIKINYLGILVIDEMQRLELKRTRGENNLLNFLHSLVNKLGIPLLFCGNPPFDETLSKKLKAARRAESGGYWKMYPLRRDSKSKDWDAFISELWDLQWTNIKTPLTEELMSKMYELSLGNLDMCCRIYREAQRSVIGSGDERINTTVLENAYYYACALSNETAEVNDLREQLGIHLPRRNKSVTEKDEDNAKPKPKLKQKPAILGDITRAQHPEFEMLIRDVLGMVNLPIKSADLFQQLSESEETYNSTSLQGILYENPLEDLR